MKYNLTLIRNNTGQNDFLFYKEVDGGRNFITESIVLLNESIILESEDYTVFQIETPNKNEDFDFISGSL